MNNTIRTRFRHRLCAAALATALFIPATAGVAGASTKGDPVKEPQPVSLTTDADEAKLAPALGSIYLAAAAAWCANQDLLFPWRCSLP